MVAVVIVTHGHLAEALVEAAELIVGELPAVAAVSLEPQDGPRAAKDKVERAIDEVDEGDGVLLLVDLPGGTPCTVCITCLPKTAAEIVSGVNLSMLVKIPFIRMTRGLTLAERAQELASYGGKAVRVITELGCCGPGGPT